MSKASAYLLLPVCKRVSGWRSLISYASFVKVINEQMDEVSLYCWQAFNHVIYKLFKGDFVQWVNDFRR